MRSYTIVLLLLSFVVSSFSYSDGHSDGVLTGWSIVGERGWQESQGVMAPVNGNSESFVLCDSVPSTSNGVLTSFFKADQWSGHNGGVVFCYSGATSYYYLTIQPGTYGAGVMTLHKASVSDYGILLSNSLSLVASDIVKLSIQITSDSLYVSVNDSLVSQVADAQFRGGKFGYYHGNSWSGYIEVDSTSWSDATPENGSDSTLEIISQPTDLRLYSGGSGAFTVGVVSGDSVTYQWFSDSGALTNATGSTFQVSNATFADSGSGYYCKVSSSSDFVISDTATLHVSTATRNMVTIKGSIRDFNNFPLGNQSSKEVDMLIQLYNAQTSGELLYEEPFFKSAGNAVVVDSGSFYVRLGAGDSTDLAAVFQENQNVYAQFHLALPGNSFEVLAPRVAITSVPYAISSNATVLKGSINPNSVGLDAPVGTFYVQKNTALTFIKTVNDWILVTE